MNTLTKWPVRMAYALLYYWNLLLAWWDTTVVHAARAWYLRTYHGRIVRVVQYDTLTLAKRTLYSVTWWDHALSVLGLRGSARDVFKFSPPQVPGLVHAVTCWNGACYLTKGPVDARVQHDPSMRRFLYACLEDAGAQGGPDVTALLNRFHVHGLSVAELAAVCAMEGIEDVPGTARWEDASVYVMLDNLAAEDRTHKGILHM